MLMKRFHSLMMKWNLYCEINILIGIVWISCLNYNNQWIRLFQFRTLNISSYYRILEGISNWSIANQLDFYSISNCFQTKFGDVSHFFFRVNISDVHKLHKYEWEVFVFDYKNRLKIRIWSNLMIEFIT